MYLNGTQGVLKPNPRTSGNHRYGNFRQQAHYESPTTRLDNVNSLQHGEVLDDFSYVTFFQPAHTRNSSISFE